MAASAPLIRRSPEQGEVAGRLHVPLQLLNIRVIGLRKFAAI
jgi:hypothetical protein